MKQITFNGNKNIIGKRLAELRKEQGLSQNDLAAKMQLLNVNIDQQMISKIEKNNRQVTDYELACFCKCLNVTADEILEEINNILS
ncbi:helix-turn-helix domain-containing protein [Eubacterium sp.]|uniref:helix-turn-helix domain-containing protein n=1 Tax=Eubacterium sp. TaxID=142586 RepID=UPI003F007069